MLLLLKLQAEGKTPCKLKLRLTLLHGCFLRFLKCTNGTKSREVSHIKSVRNKFESLAELVSANLDVLMISEIKIDETFPKSQFIIEAFSEPYLLNHTVNGGGVFLYVREDIPSKCIKMLPGCSYKD